MLVFEPGFDMFKELTQEFQLNSEFFLLTIRSKCKSSITPVHVDILLSTAPHIDSKKLFSLP